MKKLFIMPLILLFLISCSKKADTQFNKTSAVVLNIAGKVLISKDIALSLEKWKPVKAKTEIREGEYIRTRDASTCDIYLANGSVVKLGPVSILFVDKLLTTTTRLSKTNFNLKSGSLLAKPARLVSGESFTVTTPTAIAGVRGTEFVVNHENGNTSIAVKEGKVNVKRNISVKKTELTTDASKKLAATATAEETLSAGEASTLNVNENNRLRNSIREAIQNRPVNVREIIKSLRIKRRAPDVREKERFIELGKIRRLTRKEREKYGVLLIFAGENAAIYINDKPAGTSMLMRITKTGTYKIKVIKNGAVIYDKPAVIESRKRTVIRIAEPLFNAPETIFERLKRNRVREDERFIDRFRRIRRERFGQGSRQSGWDDLNDQGDRTGSRFGTADDAGEALRNRRIRKRRALRGGGWQNENREDRFRENPNPDRFRENN